MFKNRKEAAEQLSLVLEPFQGLDPLILSFPIGGVETAYYVAKHLNAELAIAITQKIKLPASQRAAFGAVAEDGSTYLSDAAKRKMDPNEVKKAIEEQMKEILQQVDLIRDGESLPEMKGRTVIIVTHGINTGAMLFTIIDLCYNRNAAKVIVAAPICSERMFKRLKKMVDEVVILHTPFFFHRVSQAYKDYSYLPEETVVQFMRRHQKDNKNNKKEKPPEV